MSKKQKPLSSRKKAAIKKGFNSIDVNELSPAEKRYYAAIKGGKASASRIRVSGRFASNRQIEEIQKVAAESGVKNWQQFYRQNEKEITGFLNGSANQIWLTHVSGLDYFERKKSRSIINTDFLNRRSKKTGIEVVEMLTELTQYLMSEFYCTGYTFLTDEYLSGKIEIKIPSSEEIYLAVGDEGTEEDVKQYIAENYTNEEGEQTFIAYFSKERMKAKFTKRNAKRKI